MKPKFYPKKPAKKSDNPLYAKINKEFIIRVYDVQNNPKKSVLTSANKLLPDEKDKELKIKHFKALLLSGSDKVTIKIRNRLKIEFSSK